MNEQPPYDQDLDEWEDELAGYFGPGLALGVAILDVPSPRGLPREAHD